MKKHLDDIYRKRWIEFQLINGDINDSRFINWRDVQWDQVVKITAFLCGNIHVFEKTNKENFKFFMNFRWTGIIKGVKINEWSIGWTDGTQCYMTNIDFYSGNIVNTTIESLKNFKKHIHPVFIGDYKWD